MAGFDPSVVQAAVDAGVGVSGLQGIRGFLGKRRGALQDFPKAPEVEAGGVPGSDSSVGSGEVGSGADDAGTTAPPIETAVLKLTKLMGKLVKDRARPSSQAQAQTLEGALDRAEGSGSWDSGSSSSSIGFRGKLSCRTGGQWAAFQPRRRVPERGSSFGPVLGTIPAQFDGLVSEARARACVPLASLDQQSVDAGSWVYAQEIMLEPSPALSSFQNRRSTGDPMDCYEIAGCTSG